MSALAALESKISALDESQREIITGGGLSKRFSRLPLWLSHPANIGAFYGLLVSFALILPYYMTEPHWFPLWLLNASLLISACLLLGMASRIINIFTGRMPIQVMRKVLYPMPFVGFTLLTLIHTELFPSSATLNYITWGLLMAPGPLYIHLSWAPRWRLLCMIEDGKNPFEGMQPKEYLEEEVETPVEDSEIMEVVEDFSSEE